jgi:hypothetical protein
MRFILWRAGATEALEATARWGAVLLRPTEPLHWPGLAPQSCFVIPLIDEPGPVAPLAPAAARAASLAR